MSNAVIDRVYFMGAVNGTAPQLRDFFERTLTKPQYTIEELNTIFRYEVIKLSDETMSIRDWLCQAQSVDAWIYCFCRYVVPFISRSLHLDAYYPDAMLQLT